MKTIVDLMRRASVLISSHAEELKRSHSVRGEWPGEDDAKEHYETECALAKHLEEEVALFESGYMVGAAAIVSERRRQVEKEGYDPDHDDGHSDDSMALVAALYATPHPLYVIEIGDHRDSVVMDMRGMSIELMDPWPAEWEDTYDGRGRHSRIRQLEIAGALCAAELDRLRRAEKVAPRAAQRCRVCGCTNDDCSGCIERTGSPCHWVEDDLCSACVERSDL